MAGLYIHIPFCKQACNYCNFHFATSLQYKSAIVDSICNEIRARKLFFNAPIVLQSIYFGGGTPSLLNERELKSIFEFIYTNYEVSDDAEITFEANPDDLSKEYLKILKSIGINRLSIGIQSFFDNDLKYMHRAHTAKNAEICIDYSLEIGFDNFSIDLIYGTPTLSDTNWNKNIEIAFKKNVPHISAYALTLEPKTPLDKMVKLGQLLPPNDEKMESHFNMLLERMKAFGYLQYEISNFAKPGFMAVHNTNYWKNEPYLGIGPSAHSYDQKNRYINIANNQKYIAAISKNEKYFETEYLSDSDRYNEFILTKMRTMWGIDKKDLAVKFGKKFFIYFEKEIKESVEKEWVIENGDIYTLSDKGKLFADRISSSLFWV